MIGQSFPLSVVRSLYEPFYENLIHVYLRDHDAVLERVLYSLSLALLFFIISLHNKLFSLTLIAGIVVALWASISYVSKELYKSHQVCVTAVRKLELGAFPHPAYD